MADLFDMKVGGFGFHLTAHLLAVVALFVACFAITGYISFRDDTVPGSALKDHDVDLEDITADTVALGGYFRTFTKEVDLEGIAITATDNAVIKEIATLPANSTILDVSLVCTELASTAELELSIAVSATAGTAAGTAIVAETNVLADSGDFMDSGQTVGDVSRTSTPVNIAAKTQLYVINADTVNTVATLTSGKFLLHVEYVSTAAAVAL